VSTSVATNRTRKIKTLFILKKIPQNAGHTGLLMVDIGYPKVVARRYLISYHSSLVQKQSIFPGLSMCTQKR
jgi:hypothetical protein